MILRQLTFAWLMALSLAAFAANTKTTVTQVTEGVRLTTDVDYTVTGTTPFTTAGSVDIQSTEHAVLILSSIKPSKVLSNWMNYIYINGEKAVDGQNCQVKMYGRGTIVFPYGQDFQPLTCYTEQNYGGEACSNYSEGHDGGFMKTLNTTTLNNRIRSFKLKRGYMVTFAIGTGGWGYSRCFIADQADLEVPTLPSILNTRISSYRLFKWFNAHKAGLADNGGYAANDALNSSWCYDWAEGNASNLPNVEWVPNHIYEGWGQVAYKELGKATYTCHIKGNNEPGNSSDDHPQDVATVLSNWQEGMRTGMRLGSESSHDGSMNHLKAFMDSIDARGWRCDFLDLHCYWDTGFSRDNLVNYSNNYGNGRPIWISEWIWGASWNNNGVFASGVTQERIYSRIVEILDALNANDRVERYAYWNSESKSHIYENGSLTELGKYYATMNVGLGYNPANEYIPKNPPLKPLGQLGVTYNRTAKAVTLSWEDPNGELMESYTIQRKKDGERLYTDVKTVAHKEGLYPNGSTSFVVNADTLSTPGYYTYRLTATAHNGTSFTSNEANVEVDPAQGIANFQYGNLNMDGTNTKSVDYSEEFQGTDRRRHAVFTGIPSYDSRNFYASTLVTNSLQPSTFSITLIPWKTTTSTTITEAIDLPFLALGYGNHQYGDLACEVNYVTARNTTTNLWTDTTTVTFTQPFPEGVTPVVLTEVRNSLATDGLSVRIFDVTNTGFKFIIYPEIDPTGTVTTRRVSNETVNYLAITPGMGYVDEENGIIIAAGHGTNNAIYASTLRENSFTVTTYDEAEQTETTEQLRFYSPVILGALQTNNYPTATMLRRTDVTTRVDGTLWTTGVRVRRILDHNITVDGTTVSSSTNSEAYRDSLGWVAVANYHEGSSVPTAIEAVPASKSASGSLRPHVMNGRIVLDGGQPFDLYSMTGAKLSADTALTPGIYVVKANGKSAKILVK